MARLPRGPEQDALATLQASLDELSTVIPGLGPTANARTRERLDEITLAVARLRAGMPKAPQSLTETMTGLVGLLAEVAPSLGPQAANTARAALAQVGEAVARAVEAMDPIRTPRKVFDPGAPDAAGRLVAIALLAQPRLPLADVGQMYGSGCYAIYYKGDHPYYAAVSGTETPIYVGKADPAHGEARNSRDQGPKLTGRLLDHRRMIVTVEKWADEHPDPANHPIRIADFEYRRLVVATNAQLVAEQCLIDFFKPIWNNEMGICWGISKHGDSAGTRANKRSPWDVLHPGRGWAMDERLENSKEPDAILADINTHVAGQRPWRDVHEIIDRFLEEFAQDAVEMGGADDVGEEAETPEA